MFTKDDLTGSAYFSATFQLGIAIVNDFKSVEGDRAMGLQVVYFLFYNILNNLRCILCNIIVAMLFAVTPCSFRFRNCQMDLRWRH